MPKPNEPKRSNFPNGNNGNRAFRNAHKAWGKLKITNNNNNEEKRRRAFAVLTPHLPAKSLAQLMTANKSVYNNVKNSPELQQKIQIGKHRRLKRALGMSYTDAFYKSLYNNVKNSPALRQNEKNRRLKHALRMDYIEAFFRYKMTLMRGYELNNYNLGRIQIEFAWRRFVAIENEIRRTLGLPLRNNSTIPNRPTININYNLMRILRS